MKKFSMPIAVFLLAIGGAFASQSTEKTALIAETGWIDTPSPCLIPVSCTNDVTTICTMTYQGQKRQAFGKNPNENACTKVLYKLP